MTAKEPLSGMKIYVLSSQYRPIYVLHRGHRGNLPLLPSHICATSVLFMSHATSKSR